MKWSNKNVLITGVGGFIGYNLAKRLLERNVNIIGIDNFSYNQKKQIEDIIKEIDLIEADATDFRPFMEIKEDIDYIFCFSSPSSIVLFNENPEKCYSETVLGTRNIFEFGKKTAVEKIILSSTGSVYGGNKKPHEESIYPKPRNLYGAAKIACESMASAYEPFIKSTVLRIFSGYGPGEERKNRFASIIYLFINDVLMNKNPIIYGDGNQERDFIYIDDVIESVIRAAEINFDGIVNIGTGKPTSFSQIIEIIQKEVGKDIEPTYIPKPENYVDSLVAETTLMKTLLKIRPLSIEKGVGKFIKYLQQKYPY